MKTKEEVIKEAYGFLFEYKKHLIDKDGWFDNSNENDSVTNGETEFLGKCDFKDNTTFRPKSLQGLEDNNGWIDSNEKLPTEFGFYHVEIENNEQDLLAYFNVEYKKWYIGDFIFNVIKWQPINYPKKSLY